MYSCEGVVSGLKYYVLRRARRREKVFKTLPGLRFEVRLLFTVLWASAGTVGAGASEVLPGELLLSST